MLPQFGLTEFMLVAIIALIVVGPKDLPMMMRKLGQFVARGKAMAREFQSAFDDIARQGELDELRKEIEEMRRENALTGAVDDLRKVESDINRKVMMENPAPGPQRTEGPAAVPDKSASSAPAGEAAPDTAPDTPPETASAEPESQPEPEPAPARDRPEPEPAPSRGRKASST